MNARKFRPCLETLEGRCTPAVFSFGTALGDGQSAVSLLVDAQAPPYPIVPEMVALSRLQSGEIGGVFIPPATTGDGGIVIGVQPGGATGDTSSGNSLDSLSEMGELESLRLQMTMDRLEIIMQTLSNVLQKMSDTEAGVIQNLR